MSKNTESKSAFTRFFQIGVVVKDLDKTIKRLEAMGIGPWVDPVLPLPPMVGEQLYRGKPIDMEIKLLGTHIGETELEIFEPVRGKSPWQEYQDSHGDGIHHIAFYVDDYEKAVAELTKKGVKVLLETKTEGGGGGVYLDMGVGGLVFELMQL
jgi:methylmalonyl-CoA/ethylmalonyl-CoA epimerase